MYLNDINFPNCIVDSIKEKKLVIFAGAGASMGKPTCLPDFRKLAREIAEGTGRKLRKNDSCEVFLGALKFQGINVNQTAADILNRQCTVHNKLHEAIIDLFQNIKDIKIVTTNYDKMFEQVLEMRGETCNVASVPAVPLGDDIEGIIHIHGIVDYPKYMVVTDEDFGRAYLTDGYAARFLVRLFEEYTVLFIGYSYNDTILRYLTRAMTRKQSNNRFILTDDVDSDWDMLGIDPIFYPKKAYAVMGEGLVKLGKISKNGLLEWRKQFEEVKDAPPKDLTMDSELDYCIQDEERAQILANILEEQWLEKLDSKNVFRSCFDNVEVVSQTDRIWAKWLCEKYVGIRDKELIGFIDNHGGDISKTLADVLIAKLLRVKDIEDRIVVIYILLAEKHIDEAWLVNKVIDYVINRKQYPLAVFLMRKHYQYNLKAKYASYANNERVNYEHCFGANYHHANWAWNALKDKLTDHLLYDVIEFVYSTVLELHQKYVMIDLADDQSEPFSMVFLDIEKHDEDFYDKSPLSVLCDMFCDSCIRLDKNGNGLVKTRMLEALDSNSMLLRKLSLKAMRETEVFSPSEKINILLNRSCLGIVDIKEQVFLLVSSIFGRLSQNEKNQLMDAIENEKFNGEERKTRFVYDWFVWIGRSDSANKRINETIMKLENKFHYKPIPHPEKIIYPAEVNIPDQSPFSKEDLMSMKMSDIVFQLSNYENDSFAGPSRYGLLNELKICIGENDSWAKKVVEALIKSETYRSDIWNYIVYGINDSKMTIDSKIGLIELICNHVSIIKCDRELSDCLLTILADDAMKKLFSKNEERLLRLSNIIWDNRDYCPEQSIRLIDLAFNSTTGNILRCWIQMVSLSKEITIPEKYKALFENALAINTTEKQIVLCILGGHFNYFCLKDKKWCKEELETLLLSKDRGTYACAWEGIAYFSSNMSKDTADLLVPIYFQAIKNIRWLKEDTRVAFFQRIILLMIYCANDPTRKYMPELYKYIYVQDRKKIIEIIGRRLVNMEVDDKRSLWEKWLKKFLRYRKNNKPERLIAEENTTIFSLLPDLDPVFEEAVDVMCEGVIPSRIEDITWFNLLDKHFGAKYPNAMAKFLVNTLKSHKKLGVSYDYVLQIANELSGIKGRTKKDLIEVLLKHNISVDL